MSRARVRTINMKIWEDEKFETFSPDERLFWHTILTNPRSNNLGSYKITIRVLQNLMGYDKGVVESLVSRFKDTYKMIDYDFKTQEVLILNFSKYNWTKSPKYKANLIKHYEKIESEDLKSKIETIFNDFYTKDDEIKAPISNELVEVPFGVSIDELFNRFWSVYPKKQAKGTAEKWFKTNKPSEELVDVMIKVVNKWKVSDNWLKDNGKYVPLPSTWLNAKRWEDELQIDVDNPRDNNDDLWESAFGGK